MCVLLTARIWITERACVVFPETTGIVFVIDCTDRQRAAKAREELHYLLDKIPGIPFIVLANKTDIDSKDWMGAAQITDILGLHSFRYRRWNILVRRCSLSEPCMNFDWIYL